MTHHDPTPTARHGRRWWVAGLAIAAVVVIVLAPLASPDPDGLDSVARDHRFLDRAQNFYSGLLSGYGIPGVNDPAVSTILSGLLGIAILVAVVWLLGRLVARRRA